MHFVLYFERISLSSDLVGKEVSPRDLSSRNYVILTNSSVGFRVVTFIVKAPANTRQVQSCSFWILHVL